MPNAITHRVGAALVVGGVSAINEQRKGKVTAAPLAHSIFATAFATLPDVLEPATNPNHRRFFHSIACAGLVGCGVYQCYRWETENEWQDLLRMLGLIAGGAYLVHLLMDAGTPKSLPII